MVPSNRVSSHPGEILQQEFLEPLALSVEAFSRHVELPVAVVRSLVEGKSAMAPELAWLLGMATGTGPELWMNLQSAYDLTLNRPQRTVQKLVGSTV